ncbi:MAG TPA: methylenetetrahydrofolate reductase, partial [Polyangia bacterium]|nr:methylenetetrahydrofolate reductase [Polyangia bacterium]
NTGVSLERLPIFPLPDVVLFPHALLPLHIFEPRYRALARDVLAGDRTVDLVGRIRRVVGIEAMAHLTCVGHSQGELAQVLDRLATDGIENVLALRGDPPRGQTTFTPAPDGFRYASELVGFIKQRGYSFCLGGACYPEGHLEAPDRETDLQNLKRKIDAGLEFIITQLFFDNAFYFHFVERARTAGITVPIIPGIMPITNAAQVERFTRMCGATVPMRLMLELERRRDDAEAVLQLGVAHATLQCAELLAHGAPGVHFYTLNRSKATRMILSALRGRYP